MISAIPISWLLIAAGCYLLFEIWRGWRRGIVRHGVSVGALILAGGVGWVFAWMTGFIADNVIPFPSPTGRVIFGIGAALVFYLVAAVLSNVLFKKTSQQPPGLTRLIYGVGGGFFGLLLGLLVLLGAVSMWRMLVVMEDAQLAPQISQTGIDKDSGIGNKIINAVDPVPANTYAIVGKLMRVTQSPEAMQRLMQNPEMEKFMTQRKVAELFNDPSLAESVNSGNIFALFMSPKLLGVASDPEVQKFFTEFDFEKALDYALQNQPTSSDP